MTNLAKEEGQLVLRNALLLSKKAHLCKDVIGPDIMLHLNIHRLVGWTTALLKNEVFMMY